MVEPIDLAAERRKRQMRPRKQLHVMHAGLAVSYCRMVAEIWSMWARMFGGLA